MNAYSAAYKASQAKVTAQNTAVEKLAAETKKGGEVAVAAWESLLVTAGIAVEGPNGKPVSLHGDTGSGWPMTDAELRLHSMLAASPGGLRLVDLANALSKTFGMSASDLATELDDELYQITDHDFGVVYNAIGPHLWDGTKKLAVGDVFLDWAQVELLMRRLATEVVVNGVHHGGSVTASYRSEPGADDLKVVTAGYDAVQAAHRPCQNSEGPWSKAILDQTTKADTQFVFDGIIGRLESLAEEKAESGAEKLWTVSHSIGFARVLLAAITLWAKATALEATFDMPNSPLVRTKDTHPGEVRDLNITYSFNPGKWQTIRECLNLFLSPIGIEIPGTSPDAPSDMDVQLSTDDPAILRIGDGTGKSEKVNQDQTDSDGKVSFKISGTQQADTIPKEATGVDKTAKVLADNDLTSSDFFSDILTVGWDAADAAGTFGLSLLPQLLARSKFIGFHFSIPVRDWKLSADFEVTAVGEVTEQYAENDSFEGCGTTISHDESDKGVASFATDPVKITAKLISNPEGNLGDQAFVFVPQGTDFTMADAGQGDGVYMFPMPVSYRTEKTYSRPGTWNKPSLYVEHEDGGCYGGGGGGTAPPPVSDDCGLRDYTSTLDATMPKARHLLLAGKNATTYNLWKHCGSPLRPTDPPVAPTLDACQNSKTTGGKVPSIADVFDTSKKRLDISGMLTCTEEEPGIVKQVDYHWSMQLCRIESGKPDC